MLVLLFSCVFVCFNYNLHLKIMFPLSGFHFCLEHMLLQSNHIVRFVKLPIKSINCGSCTDRGLPFKIFHLIHVRNVRRLSLTEKYIGHVGTLGNEKRADV